MIRKRDPIIIPTTRSNKFKKIIQLLRNAIAVLEYFRRVFLGFNCHGRTMLFFVYLTCNLSCLPLFDIVNIEKEQRNTRIE